MTRRVPPYVCALFLSFVACQGAVDGAAQAPSSSSDQSGGGNGNEGGVGSVGNANVGGGFGGGGTTSPSPTAPLEVPAGRGLFECPAVSAPAYEDGVTKGAALSDAFGRYCSGCHGSAGEGKGLYPPLPQKLDVATFLSTVRKGVQGKAMPAFDEGVVSDATLRADFMALQALASNGRNASSALPAEQSWSQQRVDEAYQRGMQAWRKPDSHGAACVSCHSPDAIDLAVIAYPDAAIMRRGALHLSPDDVLAVRDLVHAQRRRFGIKTPCSTEWRPFQPGGEVLPGNTPAEQDASLGAYLGQQGLLLMKDPVTNAAAAETAWKQFAELDLRKTKIGIALPHWTRDVFNGPGHQTFDDWMTSVDFTPNLNELIAANDRYIADPSDSNYFSAEKAALGSLGNSQAGLYKEWFTNASRNKRRALLLGSHHFRAALSGKPGWYDLPAVPYPRVNVRYSPFALLGGMTQEYACSSDGGSFGGGTCPQLFSNIGESQRPKFGGPTEAQVNQRLESFTHSWWTLANLFDQGVMRSEDNAIDGGMFYWAGRFPQSNVHMPLFYAHAVAVKWLYDTTLASSDLFPVVEKPLSHPRLLDGYAVNDRTFVGLPGHPEKETSPSFESGVILRANLLRTILLLQKQLLDGGSGVAHPEGILKLYETGLPNASWFVGGLNEMWNAAGFEQRHPRLAGKKALFATGLDALMKEVVAKVKAARVIAN